MLTFRIKKIACIIYKYKPKNSMGVSEDSNGNSE